MPRIVVQPPNEALGGFLTLEAPSPAVVNDLLESIDEKSAGFSLTYNVFLVHGNSTYVTIEEDDSFVPQPSSCTVSTDEFRKVCSDWLDYLHAQQR